MKYTRENLMPKPYPANKPKETSAKYHIYTKNFYFSAGWYPWWFYDSKNYASVWDAHVDWFIDIPGAPPEVKPLAYPENLPPHTGKYIVHEQDSDIWKVFGWGIWGTKGKNRIDYFIPVCLDESEDDVSSVTCKNCQQITCDYNKLRLAGDKLSEAAIRVVGEYDGLHRLRLAISEWAKVTANEYKRWPEILPCPFCGHDDLSEYDFVYVDDEPSEIAIECRGCGLRGTPRNSLAAAIEAWNALPRNL